MNALSCGRVSSVEESCIAHCIFRLIYNELFSLKLMPFGHTGSKQFCACSQCPQFFTICMYIVYVWLYQCFHSSIAQEKLEIFKFACLSTACFSKGPHKLITRIKLLDCSLCKICGSTLLKLLNVADLSHGSSFKRSLWASYLGDFFMSTGKFRAIEARLYLRSTENFRRHRRQPEVGLKTPIRSKGSQ